MMNNTNKNGYPSLKKKNFKNLKLNFGSLNVKMNSQNLII